MRAWGDRLVAAALLVAGAYQLAAAPARDVTATGGRAPLYALLALLCGALVWRRSRPVAAALAVTAAYLAAALLITDIHFEDPAPWLGLILAFYSLGAHGEERRALIAGAGALAAIAALDLAHGVFDVRGHAQPLGWLLLGFAWLFGRDLRRRRRQLALLGREREERARAAVADERARIARELHDVVAHGVSVMVVQAQAGPRLLGEPERARAAFRAIEASGRDALVELRRLLGILRRGDEELAVGPQPGLASLPALVEQVGEAGLRVDVRQEGRPAKLPLGVDLSAYRIVQEALTNTLKHAGAARAQVVVRYGDGELELEIDDDGRGAVNGHDGHGHGLIGMRERAALYGGEVSAGARAQGGYTVRARLPLGGAR